MATQTEPSTPFVGLFRKRAGNVTFFEVRGEATPGGVLALFRQFLADRTPLALWDMRQFTLSHLADDELRWLVRQLMELQSERRVYGRSAFVCPRDADNDVLRTLIAYAQAEGYGIHLAAFREIDDARCWLAEV